MKMIMYSDNYRPVSKWTDANMFHVADMDDDHPHAVPWHIGDHSKKPAGFPDEHKGLFEFEGDLHAEFEKLEKQDNSHYPVLCNYYNYALKP